MIPLLVPDLPRSDDLMPWMQEIDHNRWYSNYGPLCARFEQELVQLLKRKNPRCRHPFSMVSTSSGTTALEVGLGAYRLRPGTRVVLPSLTFPATATAVIRSGMIPVLSDVDPDSWVLTPEIAAQIVQRSGAKVVIPVAAYGHKLDERLWADFASEYDCHVLIDSAGAFPAHVPVPDVNIAYSFHATKSLGIGEGGGILSVDSEYLQTARELTNFGFDQGAVNLVGTNAKLSEYHAAVGLCQITRFDAMQSKRLGLFHQLRQAMAQQSQLIEYQAGQPAQSPTLYVVSLPGNATAVSRHMELSGVGARQWYCPPLHLHPAFSSYIKNASLKYGDLSISEQLAKRIIGLPFHPSLSTQDIEIIAQTLNVAVAKHCRDLRQAVAEPAAQNHP